MGNNNFNFLFILSGNLTKYVYLTKQQSIEQYNLKIQNLQESLNDLQNDISQLSMDKRVISFAIQNLDMIFPSPKNIICVHKNKVSENNYQYTLQSVLSPAAIASENP